MEDYASVREAVWTEGVKDSDIPDGPLKELAMEFAAEKVKRDRAKDG